jgi:hypothetical protein
LVTRGFKLGGAALSLARIDYALREGETLTPGATVGYFDGEVASRGIDSVERWAVNTLEGVLPEPDPSWFGLRTYPTVP